MEMHELLDRVQDRESFLDFVDALVRDREEAVAKEREHPTLPEHLGACPDAGGWNNTTIESYLKASLSWTEGREEWPEGQSATQLWKSFAEFLYVGKIYE